MTFLNKDFTVDAMFNTHSHPRQGEQAWALLNLSVEGGMDIIHYMPNPGNGLLTKRDVREYDDHARARPGSQGIGLVPSFMLTEDTTEEMIDECADADIMDGKGYPKDRTNSSSGIKRYARILPQIKHCGKRGVRVHLHPEHPSPIIGNRDAELLFMPIVQMYLEETDAVIVWEHGSDARCIPQWKKWAETGRFFVGLTAHHLAANEDMVFGDVRAVCKPPIKTEWDRSQLVRLVEEGHSWVMAGLDDANHPEWKKHVHEGCCACGAATTRFGFQLYAHALDGLLEKPGGVEIFQNFTSRNARRIFGVPAASRQVRFLRKPYVIPLRYKLGDWTVEPFWANQKLLYSLE